LEFIKLKSNKGEIIDGLIQIIPDVYNDERGYFLESWNNNKLNKFLGREIKFTQDNISKSKKNVIRGLHYQIKPNPQAKLIRCLAGSIFDVAVDIRINSKTFGQWAGIKLSEKNKFQFLIPEGFAHGFLSLENNSIIYYKITNKWVKELERAIVWNDKEIDILWPLPDKDFILSQKDENAFSFSEAIKLNDIF
tara:strand:+ start:494 stop:1072 length:579 start_codon:yes stop_codon:yes gene_type:complete